MKLYKNKEELAELTQAQCEKQLKQLHKEYDVELELVKCWGQVWPNLDDIVNTLLWLEERIDYIKMCDQLDSIRHKKNLSSILLCLK